MNERLDGLLTALGKHFGKLTRWRAMCQERDVTTDKDKIRLSDDVLAAYSSGTVAEWHSFHLRLQGRKPLNIDDVLSGRAAGARREPPPWRGRSMRFRQDAA